MALAENNAALTNDATEARTKMDDDIQFPLLFFCVPAQALDKALPLGGH
jgi:hypothetical protein